MTKKFKGMNLKVNIEGLEKLQQAMDAATKAAVEGVVEFSEAFKQVPAISAAFEEIDVTSVQDETKKPIPVPAHMIPNGDYSPYQTVGHTIEWTDINSPVKPPSSSLYDPTAPGAPAIHDGVLKGLSKELGYDLDNLVGGEVSGLKDWQKKWAKYVDLGKRHYTPKFYVRLKAKHVPEKVGFIIEAIMKFHPKKTFLAFVPHETLLEHNCDTDERLKMALVDEWYKRGQFEVNWSRPIAFPGEYGKDGWIVNYLADSGFWRIRQRGAGPNPPEFPDFIDVPQMDVVRVGRELVASHGLGASKHLTTIFTAFSVFLVAFLLENKPGTTRVSLIEL